MLDGQSGPLDGCQSKLFVVDDNESEVKSLLTETRLSTRHKTVNTFFRSEKLISGIPTGLRLWSETASTELSRGVRSFK